MRKKRFSLAQLLLAIALTAAAVLGCGLLAVRAWMGEGGRSLVEGLRLVNTLSAAARLSSDLPLSLEDRDIVELVSEICQRAGALAPLLDLEVRFSCPMEHHLCAFAPDALEQLIAYYQS